MKLEVGTVETFPNTYHGTGNFSFFSASEFEVLNCARKHRLYIMRAVAF